MQILIKIGLNPAELWPKPFLLGQLLFDFPCLLGQLLAGPSIRKPRYVLPLHEANGDGTSNHPVKASALAARRVCFAGAAEREILNNTGHGVSSPEAGLKMK